MEYGPNGVGNIDVVPADGEPYAIVTIAPDNLLKSGWNFLLVEADGSLGVHNPDFAEEVLETTEEALAEIVGGGGIGGSANAVACTSTYVYWTEIAARLNGSAGSVFRTDVVAKNNADAMANVTFYLHADSQLFQGPGSIDAGAQGVFEDIVNMMAPTAPRRARDLLLSASRGRRADLQRFDDGTFGQFLDGINFSGFDEGDNGRLDALRQMTGEFRTNISVTNTGMHPQPSRSRSSAPTAPSSPATSRPSPRGWWSRTSSPSGPGRIARSGLGLRHCRGRRRVRASSPSASWSTCVPTMQRPFR